MWSWPWKELQGFGVKSWLISALLSLEASPERLKNIIKSLGEGRDLSFPLHLEREEKGSLEFIWRMRRLQVLEDFSDYLQKQIFGVVLAGLSQSLAWGENKGHF